MFELAQDELTTFISVYFQRTYESVLRLRAVNTKKPRLPPKTVVFEGRSSSQQPRTRCMAFASACQIAAQSPHLQLLLGRGQKCGLSLGGKHRVSSETRLHTSTYTDIIHRMSATWDKRAAFSHVLMLDYDSEPSRMRTIVRTVVALLCIDSHTIVERTTRAIFRKEHSPDGEIPKCHPLTYSKRKTIRAIIVTAVLVFAFFLSPHAIIR